MHQFDDQTNPTRHRRRGSVLEAALLEAAWDELIAVGYATLTMDGVAARAKTSKVVLYRRWPTRAQLVLAALRHHKTTTETPDTGSLRHDVLALLRDVSSRNAEFVGLVSLLAADYYSETGLPPAELRERMPGGGSRTMETILRRAIARGEIEFLEISPRLASLPIDLVRHELTMTMAPVPDEVLEEIVDSLFLPLVTKRQG